MSADSGSQDITDLLERLRLEAEILTYTASRVKAEALTFSAVVNELAKMLGGRL